MNSITPHIDRFPEEAALVYESAAAFFNRPDRVASIRQQFGRPPGYRCETWKEMSDLGWFGWRIGEADGGVGLTFLAGCLLHEELGAGLAPEPLLATAVLAVGVLNRSRRSEIMQRWLADIAAGKTKISLAWQEGSTDAAHRGKPMLASLDGAITTITGTKCYVPLVDADAFLVTATSTAGTGIYLVRRDQAGVRVNERRRIDGSYWGELELSQAVIEPDAVVVTPEAGDAVLQQALDEARLVLSAELVGAMMAAFTVTLDYIRTRRQFGQPVGSFQAVQHRAVDLAALIEVSRSVVLHGAQVFDDTDDPALRSAAASRAKARASSSAIEVLNGCIQLHGGIAYTEECDIGLYLKRVMVNAAWLGDATENRRRAMEVKEADRSRVARQPSGGESAGWLAEMRDWIERNLPAEFQFPIRRMSWREAHLWHEKLHEKGWVAPAWPVEYGGMGMKPYEHLMLHDLFDKFGINIFQNMGITMLGPLLHRYGTEEQKKRYLPDILSGKTYWCQGYSEPEAGSDLASLRTSAVLEGDQFVVNGQKIWTSLAHEADMIFLLVRTDPGAKKQSGISFLLVDMRSPGITINPIVNLTGATDFCSVFFDNVEVPAENLVGKLNEGWSMAKSVLDHERIMIGNPRFPKAALQLLKQLAVSRGVFEESAFRALFDKLTLDIADLECLYVRYLEVLRRGEHLGAEVSLLKIWNSETWQRVVEALRELAGEQATIDEQVDVGGGLLLHAANQFLHARPATIYGGTNEIQRNILARALLDLPGK
jgi:alkylation response protein AidB-like acyl-CoA dehydrogenase